MKRAIFIIANNYRGNPAIRELNVGHDMIALGGFFRYQARYDIAETVQDMPREKVLEHLQEVLDQLSAGDLLMIYFGGHGVLGVEDLLVLPPGKDDAEGSRFGFLPVSELRRRTEGLGLQRAMIFDCCRNNDAEGETVRSAADAFTRRVSVSDPSAARDVGLRPAVAPPAGVGKGAFAIFYACSEDDVAPEVGKTGKGLFSTALTRVLERAHAEGRRVRVDDVLRDEVEAEMHELAEKAGQPHRPQPWKAGNGSPVVMEGKAEARPAVVIATPSTQPRVEAVSKQGRKTITSGVGMRFVRIEPGTFLMGSPEDEDGRDLIYERQHQVTLTKPFYMATTAVSQASWKAIMGAGDNPSRFVGDDLPVEHVSWHDAVEFCEALSRREGKKYRLPTEAEWEYCCRAGTTTAFNVGGTIHTDQANYNGSSAYGRGRTGEYRRTTVPVESFSPNAWGLYQMHGNVWEWCQDVFDGFTALPATDPPGGLAQAGCARVRRGGCWSSIAGYCRSARREHSNPDKRSALYLHEDFGIRVVLDCE